MAVIKLISKAVSALIIEIRNYLFFSVENVLGHNINYSRFDVNMKVIFHQFTFFTDNVQCVSTKSFAH